MDDFGIECSTAIYAGRQHYFTYFHVKFRSKQYTGHERFLQVFWLQGGGHCHGLLSFPKQVFWYHTKLLLYARANSRRHNFGAN